MDLVRAVTGVKVQVSEVFEWNPREQTITYNPRRIDTHDGRWQFLHELAHALLGHDDLVDNARYAAERDAWSLARQLAKARGLGSNEPLIVHSLREVRSLGF